MGCSPNLSSSSKLVTDHVYLVLWDDLQFNFCFVKVIVGWALGATWRQKKKNFFSWKKSANLDVLWVSHGSHVLWSMTHAQALHACDTYFWWATWWLHTHFDIQSHHLRYHLQGKKIPLSYTMGGQDRWGGGTMYRGVIYIFEDSHELYLKLFVIY